MSPKKPILWSLHDENPYTGGCHYTMGCKNFQTQCQSCPKLGSDSKRDLSYKTFKQKQKIYPKLNLTINGLSTWIAAQAKHSALLKNAPIINLPNPIDTKIFHPIAKKTAREIFGFSQEKILIGFGAKEATSVPRKGYQELIAALSLLENKERYLLVVFGASSGKAIPGLQTHFLGHLFDDVSLTLLYNCLDLYITTSLEENLSNTIMESLACGTPVVAFAIGGNGDMITHKYNGYLAKDVSDLKNGILFVQDRKDLSQNARKSVERFAAPRVAKEYLLMYTKIMGGGRDDSTCALFKPADPIS
ncbi:glycosyltransferase [Helicobacter mustelae]|uniref:glycosyltransferase n=1 Tax=Helicobacter mustelae TaxID=217 RepID=UPI000E0E42E6|nr:glycosyltransferase [Helicobacter mustelae]